MPPDTVGGSFTFARVFVPIGFWTTKDYVEPTCCVHRTAGFFKTTEDLLATAAAEDKQLLVSASTALIAARGCMVRPAYHEGAFAEFERAVLFLSAVRVQRQEAEELIESIVSLVKQMTLDTVRDVLFTWAALGSTEIAFGPKAQQRVHTLGTELSELDAARISGARETLKALRQLYAHALMTQQEAQQSAVFLDIEALPVIGAGEPKE